MVRKRSRSSRSARKSYDYDSDENDSDLDFDLEDESASQAPKRYSLRERKRPLFCEDFDYEDDEEAPPKPPSDDDEYNVEADLEEEKAPHFLDPLVYPDISQQDEASAEDGLIDFEDMIRADVVLNKQRLDYDNIINKTEIQVQPIQEQEQPQQRPKARRGRKPKVKPEYVYDTNEFMEEEMQENALSVHSPEDETSLEVQLDPANLVQTDFEDNGTEVNENGISAPSEAPSEALSISPETNAVTVDDKIESPKEEIQAVNGVNVEEESHIAPPEIDEKDKEVMLSNEYLLANSFGLSAEEFIKKQELEKDIVEEEEEIIPQINFDDESDGDDVIIVEDQPNVIVLDDD